MIEPDLAIVLLRSVYFALYNNHRTEAMKAIQAMQKRARYEISAQVIKSSREIELQCNHSCCCSDNAVHS